ncbi:MAG: hypothetical protein Q7T33_10170 [Dehalococcoidia bacterium]|nr:hypothetical protein [Dehalococcoidia bacterium]
MAIELEAVESGSPIPLEAGAYVVVVAGVEEAEGQQFGAQVKLLLDTVNELDAGGQPYTLWAWASRKLSTQSKLWRWVTAITGSPPEVGKVFRIEDLLLGKACRAQISEEVAPDGTTRKKVTDILPPSKRPAPAAAEALAPFCSECADPVTYYTAGGVAYCGAHGPQGGAV